MKQQLFFNAFCNHSYELCAILDETMLQSWFNKFIYNLIKLFQCFKLLARGTPDTHTNFARPHWSLKFFLGSLDSIFLKISHFSFIFTQFVSIGVRLIIHIILKANEGISIILWNPEESPGILSGPQTPEWITLHYYF